ncbi:MAG: phosphoenolpyruvate carboxykinase, partial [Gemmataceae bacterium]
MSQIELIDKAVPNKHVRGWLKQCIELCTPEEVLVVDGSPREKNELIARAVKEKVLIELNQQKLPGCYLHRSNPNDVARTEHCTYICTPTERLAGPTNNWMAPREAYDKLRGLFAGCMRGKTMFVV